MKTILSIPTDLLKQESIVNRNQLRWSKINEIASNIEDGRRFSSFYDLEEVVEALTYRDLGEMKRQCVGKKVVIPIVKGKAWVELYRLYCRLIVGEDFSIELLISDTDGVPKAQLDVQNFLSFADRVQGTASLNLTNADCEYIKPLCLNNGELSLSITGEIQVVSDLQLIMELPECQQSV